MSFKSHDNANDISIFDAYSMLPKRINDPIHGLMEFDDWTLSFIDTPHFQRLRNIKQLGTTYYVFPGASHNRFEHCLGTAYLANTLVKRIQVTQPNYKVEKDLECVTLAALCHDLGHGPFSHTFDNTFIPKARKGFKWRHEDASLMMFDHLWENHCKDTIDLDTDDVKFIKSLITGNVCSGRSRYLFDIVANNTNSIDVDKFDYLNRDCYYLGMKSVFDFSRLMRFSRVIDDQIAYYFKESYSIYELFHTRYSLYKKVYYHRVGKAIEYMLCDAMAEADPILEISKAVDDPEKYLKLDDTILNQIEFSTDPRLEKSRKLIKRIRTRDLYRFVDEYIIPLKLKDHLTETKVNAREIIAHQSDNDKLGENDVIVDRIKLNYAKKNENPVDCVKFYNQYEIDKAFYLDKSQVSYLVPEQYEETIIRIFTRDDSKRKAVQESFRKLLNVYDSDNDDPNSSGSVGYTLPKEFSSPPKKRPKYRAKA
ncbi:12102_t:CDS:10 [Funneliformis caledonium]|uniref:12102_t:CDS:1 n=1 Tax=Funneliformis caledonium TaxID=1117310 RepID=A0A9N8ZEW0_9GLOM|nr:12102_t:CDS:10 [Funneliformis caledonium]